MHYIYEYKSPIGDITMASDGTCWLAYGLMDKNILRTIYHLNMNIKYYLF